ncbi:hypothetical protein MMUR_00730 [Mycolicibacterium murale]|uniref:Uncharacterized protein n=1 Tax=Mycolicibacterium murale TaxID=182220 RepID=A0A7I9WF88_9MYCO|nr:hypothetical protein MMUR_00730 [Mycolicibacterium murale]
MLGVEGLRCVLDGGLGHRLVPPQIAALGPLDVDAGAAHHQDMVDGLSSPRPAMASSTPAFSETACPRRYCPSVVMTSLAEASSMRALSALAEKPANTTECMTPRRAHASIATMASGTIGM